MAEGAIAIALMAAESSQYSWEMHSGPRSEAERMAGTALGTVVVGTPWLGCTMVAEDHADANADLIRSIFFVRIFMNFLQKTCFFSLPIEIPCNHAG